MWFRISGFGIRVMVATVQGFGLRGYGSGLRGNRLRISPPSGVSGSALEPSVNNLKRFKDLYLHAKAIIWP